jgi:predicted lipoprotein with Yx(FWY)xxD motif
MIRSFDPQRAGGRLRMPLVAAAAVIVVAACGYSSGNAGWRYGAAPSSAPPAQASGAAGGAVLVLRHTTLGTILTTGQGFTVYAFEADHGTASACTGACAAEWPPVTTGSTRITVAGGAARALAGQTTRPGGEHQLTYAGHPLYTFAGDASPGATNGQGSEAFGARWDVLTQGGQEVTGD